MIDIVLLIPLVYGAYQGFQKGLVYQIANFFTIFIGLYLAYQFSSHISTYLIDHHYVSATWAWAMSCIFILVAIFILMRIASKILTGILRVTGLQIFNKIGGAGVGFIQYVCTLSPVLLIFSQLTQRFPILPADTLRHSMVYTPLVSFAQLLKKVIF